MVLKKIGVTPFAHFASILTNAPVKFFQFFKRAEDFSHCPEDRETGRHRVLT